jgi:putative DNA primase/helicase
VTAGPLFGRDTFPVSVRLFGGDGLYAVKAARAVLEAGPLMVDAQGVFWVYADGVWRPDETGIEIRRRTVRLLGERYRPTHSRTVREVLSTLCERFEVGPASAVINFRNGMLRWAGDPDPVLVDHHPEFMSTVRVPLDWDPSATCPLFDEFLAAAVPADDLERAWQVLGYLLMSGNPLQRMFMLTGTGGNGKGVYLNVIHGLLGNDNTAAEPLHDLAETRFSAAELHGKLANICGDIDATFLQNTANIKKLCGDDRMKGEFKNERQFYFRFWGKAIFSANAIPGTSDSSRGWTRRWEVVPFPYAPTKPDPTLSDRIVASELPGIAVRAIDALRSLMSAGEFSRGESADLAHSEFAEKANRVLRWINDPDSNVRPEIDTWNKGTILLSAFRQWETYDQGNGHKDIGSQRFNELARQAGLTPSKRRGQRGYYGLHVAETVMVRPADAPWQNQRLGEMTVGEVPPQDQPLHDQMTLTSINAESAPQS